MLRFRRTIPQLSCFTPCGSLSLSSKDPLGLSIYNSYVANLGGNYSVAAGSREDCTAYAVAMGVASLKLTAERAGNQMLPDKVHELLPTREREYGLTPGPYDSEASRTAALQARYRLPIGAAKVNIQNALTDLLGSDFIAYRPTPYSESVKYPPNIGDNPMLLTPASYPRKMLRITPAISTGLGGSITVRYTNLLPNTGALKNQNGKVVPADFTDPIVNDFMVIEPENNGRREVVHIEATGIDAPPGVEIPFTTLTATFNFAHEPNCLAVAMPYPMWTSTKRHSLIVLTATAAADPEKRRRVDELMTRIARDVSTWNICAGTSSSTSGPWKVGQSLIGITTIGAVSLP